MLVIQVESEWDLGIPEIYINKEIAELHVKSAVKSLQEHHQLDLSYEEAVEENYITYHSVTVIGSEDSLNQLKNNIFNMPTADDIEMLDTQQRVLYKTGFRDARHAAVQLINKWEDE